MTEVILGKVSDFQDFPAAIEIVDQHYFLLKNQTCFVLVSRVCPHMGYLVEHEQNKIVCHWHGWTFNDHTGVCEQLPKVCLPEYPVAERKGNLFAIM